MLQVLLIASTLLPLVLALVGLGRFALVRYRRWRALDDERDNEPWVMFW